MKIRGKKIEKLGFWKEYTLNSDDSSVHDLTFTDNFSNKKEILEYLNSGIRVLLTRNAARCKLHGDIFAPHGEVFFDGEWLWTEGIIYYFEEYNLMLPQRFLKKIENNNFTIPIKEEDIPTNYLQELSSLALSLISPSR